jgi:hypothetical protein
LAPNFSDACELLETTYIQLAVENRGKIDEIVRLLKESVRLNPNTTAHALLGRIYDVQGNFEEANQEYKEHLRIYPNWEDLSAKINETPIPGIRAKASDELVRRMLGLPPFHEFRSWSEIRKSALSIDVDVPKTKPVKGELHVQQPEIDQSLAYRLIIEICQKSQETMNKRSKEIGQLAALTELTGLYESLWQEYAARITKQVEFKRVSFSGLLFKRARFKNHNFIECDFSGSRWILSFIEDSNCTGSNFSRIGVAFFPFKNTNCVNCDFSNAQIHFFDPCGGNNFKNTNFTNAKLNSSHSFFEDKRLSSRSIFENAVMNGCRLIIKKEPPATARYNRTKRELRSFLEKIFSPDQIAVMHIDYEG